MKGETMREPMPVLLARPSKSGETLLVWCPYCLKEHTHGPGAGHRTAHCITGPFLDTGYIIALPGSAYLRRLQRKRPALADGAGRVLALADGTVA